MNKEIRVGDFQELRQGEIQFMNGIELINTPPKCKWGNIDFVQYATRQLTKEEIDWYIVNVIFPMLEE